MTKDDALKLALEFVENVHLGEWQGSTERQEEIVTAINKALAQPAQEPVAYLCGPDENGLFGLPTADKACKDCFPVYTAPPQRTWVGLTDDERNEIASVTFGRENALALYVDAIEAKLKEKNS